MQKLRKAGGKIELRLFSRRRSYECWGMCEASQASLHLDGAEQKASQRRLDLLLAGLRVAVLLRLPSR